MSFQNSSEFKKFTTLSFNIALKFALDMQGVPSFPLDLLGVPLEILQNPGDFFGTRGA